MGDQQRGTALLVEGDLNTDLGATDNDRRGSEITAALTEAGVEDMSAHFLPRKGLWGRERRTWIMVREGRVIRSRTDYLLGTDRSLFRNVSVRDPRHNSDHFMVVGNLRSGKAQDHARYIKGRRRMPLNYRRNPRGRMSSLASYRGQCQNRTSGRNTRTSRFLTRRGDSSTRESLPEGGRG